MGWSTTRDAREFAGRAGGFLASRPVDHTLLLTETAYLVGRPGSGDQLFGWWTSSGGGPVSGAFLRAPAHPPILSHMPGAAVWALPGVLVDADRIGVDARLADEVVAAWRGGGGSLAGRGGGVSRAERGGDVTRAERGGDVSRAERGGGACGAERGPGEVELVESSRVTLHRMREVPEPPAVPGRARAAGPADREVLVDWFHRLMAAHPDDQSELAYVVDEPLARAGIAVWEVDGSPVAMAGTSPAVAGMVRVSAVYSPNVSPLGERYAAAAFAAACALGRERAREVLVFGGALSGFEPVLDRVVLSAPPSVGRATAP
jgi:hypothetical protein